jgi:hypothetical protein
MQGKIQDTNNPIMFPFPMYSNQKYREDTSFVNLLLLSQKKNAFQVECTHSATLVLYALCRFCRSENLELPCDDTSNNIPVLPKKDAIQAPWERPEVAMPRQGKKSAIRDKNFLLLLWSAQFETRVLCI